MKKSQAALWAFILLFSLGLIVFLLFVPKQPPPSPASTAPAPAPTATPRALVLAPTRFLPTVAAPPTATDLPTALPTMTPFVLTPAAPAPRMFQAFTDNIPSRLTLATYCAKFGKPISLRIYDWSDGSTISLSDEAIARIPLGWNASGSIWQGYQSAHPFDQPADARERWKLTLYLPDQTEHWIDITESAQTPALYYVYTFQNTVAFADSAGKHYGFHPCRAFSIAKDQVDSFLKVVTRYQDVVRFPALIPGDDPRWTRGTARPVEALADLRAIPSTAYNDPIGGIDAPVTLWYAIDPAWGAWAQVKMGSVQGWVDTGLVTFTPAS